MDEAAIRKTAARMMKLYGSDAESAAAVQADAMLSRGNITGFHAWTRITAILTDLACDVRKR
jgi:hypothetical protein